MPSSWGSWTTPSGQGVDVGIGDGEGEGTGVGRETVVAVGTRVGTDVAVGGGGGVGEGLDSPPHADARSNKRAIANRAGTENTGRKGNMTV